MARINQGCSRMHVTINGHRVFSATGGQPFDAAKPVVVFLHGAGCDRTSWMQLGRWSAHHGWSVLAPDLPGHGRSGGAALTSIEAMVDWTEQLLAAVNVARAALVGHSMGGAIALEVAARLGPRITHLVLIGTAAAIPVGKPLLDAAHTDPARAYDLMTQWALAPASRMGRNPSPGLWLPGHVRSVFGANAAPVLATDLSACAAWTTGSTAAARVTAKAHVIAADLDIMTPAKRGQDLANAIPGAGFTLLRQSGHMIMSEAPDACLQALRTALGPLAAAA
jgi:pimeloyl-ACP methyl ester carboxylesterase